MARLTLSLLGTFAASLDGAPLAGFRSAKTRALLAYLAVEHGRDHPREALVDLLWPDQPFKSANTNFRQTLSRLQRLVGNKTAVPPFLHVTRQSVRWESTGDYALDLLHVQNALAAAQTDRRTLGEITGVLRHSLGSIATRLRDVPARQRSLWAVAESSWVLLTESQQQLLARLAIFRDSFTFGDATAVATQALPYRMALSEQELP